MIFRGVRFKVPKTYAEVLAAAEAIQAAGLVDYPLGGTFMAGWNLGEEFVNMYLGMGANFLMLTTPLLSTMNKGLQPLRCLKL
ncbi:MAG: hypothetical protein R2880_19635 [Deinococcales bacterium]